MQTAKMAQGTPSVGLLSNLQMTMKDGQHKTILHLVFHLAFTGDPVKNIVEIVVSVTQEASDFSV